MHLVTRTDFRAQDYEDLQASLLKTELFKYILISGYKSNFDKSEFLLINPYTKTITESHVHLLM